MLKSNNPFACLLLVMLLIPGCAVQEAGAPEPRWRSPLYQDHLLAGLIWKPEQARYATAGEIYGAMKKADFVLIGEKHDNPDHHWIQAKLVSELAAFERDTAVVFEMLTESQQAPLDTYLESNPRNAAGIGEAVGWESSGWPDWRMYQPIAQQALYNDIPLLAGGLDRDMIQELARSGTAALGKTRARRLMLGEPVSDRTTAEMKQVIYDSHCQQLPEPMLAPMVSITLAKDAAMADRMIESRNLASAGVAILIAGTGHVRNDWGVPMHLRRRLPDARIVTVGLTEVQKEATDPTEYGERYGERMPFDFVWFTPRVDDRDPCEVFAEQLKRIREKSQHQDGSGQN